jgi:hypothetical protein
MADPENRTLHLLGELRNDIKAIDRKLDTNVDALDQKIDRNHNAVIKRLDSLQRSQVGESVLGRYATAEFEERIEAIERRLSALEAQQ